MSSACELSSRSRLRSPSSASGMGEIDLRQDQAVGEDHLLARFRRPADGFEAGRGVDHRHDDLDEELAAERAVGRKRLEDRRRVGHAAGLDHDAHERRNLAALAIDHEIAQRVLQVGAGDAADAAVAEQRGLIGRAADQRVVDADRSVFVDDDGGAAAFRRRQEIPQQRGLARAQEAGEHGDRDAAPARVLEAPSERARRARGEEFKRCHAGLSPRGFLREGTAIVPLASPSPACGRVWERACSGILRPINLSPPLSRKRQREQTARVGARDPRRRADWREVRRTEPGASSPAPHHSPAGRVVADVTRAASNRGCTRVHAPLLQRQLTNQKSISRM